MKLHTVLCFAIICMFLSLVSFPVWANRVEFNGHTNLLVSSEVYSVGTGYLSQIQVVNDGSSIVSQIAIYTCGPVILNYNFWGPELGCIVYGVSYVMTVSPHSTGCCWTVRTNETGIQLLWYTYGYQGPDYKVSGYGGLQV